MPKASACTLFVVFVVMLTAFRVAALEDLSSDPVHDPQQVFLVSNSQLIFIDLLTGNSRTLPVNGDHFTVVHNGVMYFDRTRRQVVIVAPDGTRTEHPFIQPSDGVTRIDWTISHDEQTIAWTETSGAPTALTTRTYVAGIDGAQQRPVLSDGPRNSIRAYPVAFNEDKSILYMDYQPDTIGDLTPFRQYAGLFALDLVSGSTNSLPGEPGCFCGAGIGGDTFLRLTLADSGFNLRIRSLTNSTEATLAPINDYTQGGDVLIAPDGNRAVYALAQITGFGTPAQTVQTVIVLVDLLNLSQRALAPPVNRLLRPILWTEDDSAVLFADPQSQTTWKAMVRDSSIEQVASGIYLGTLVPG
ncbi:MAG: hypothetical protein GC204_17015 [Chloroflexi bacterium]|nr:hypothetical protein [Chloroflexota bacterium]